MENLDFLDCEVSEFCIGFSANEEKQGYKSSVKFVSNDGTFVNGRITSNWNVIEFLNRDSFFGFTFSKNRVINNWMERYSPTPQEEQTLKDFIEKILLPGQGIEKTRTKLRLFPDLSCKLKVGVSYSGENVDSTEYQPNLYYCCEKPYDLFLCECYEMYRRQIKVYKCQQCGRYFFPPTAKDSKFCSKKCRQKSQEENLSPIEREYRLAYRVRNKYKNRHKENPEFSEIEKAYKKWMYEAVEKKAACETGSISFDEFLQFLKIPFRTYAGLEDVDNGEYY